MNKNHKEKNTWSPLNLANALKETDKISLIKDKIFIEDDVVSMVLTAHTDLVVRARVNNNVLYFNVLLWPVDGAINKPKLDDLLLRSSKNMELSSFGIREHLGDDYYELFGALSAYSEEFFTTMDDIALEINTLSDNINLAVSILMESESHQ